MKKFFPVFVLIALMMGVASAELECEVKGSCDADESKILKLSNAYNAHVAKVGSGSQFNERLCCKNPDGSTLEINDSSAGDSTFLFGLEQDNNSHISPIENDTPIFKEDYYIRAEGYSLSCTLEDGACPPGFGCILRSDYEEGLSPSYYGHVQNCSYTSFPKTICCEAKYYLNISGNIREENTTGDEGPSYGARVEARYKSNYGLIDNTTTNMDGNYSLKIELSENTDIMLVIKKQNYTTQSFEPTHGPQNSNININTTLRLESLCLEDCTRRGEDRCDPDCHGINGCMFNSTYAKDKCDGRGKGWTVDYNATHIITCCDGGPFEDPGIIQQNITTEENITNIESYDLKTLIRRGEQVTLHLTTWE